MLNYLLIVLVIVAGGIMVTVNADPVEIDKQINYTINSQITNNVLDYSIDKFFFETDGDGLKPGWYSLGYYFDSAKKDFNDSIHLKFLGNGNMTESIYSQLGEFHKDLGGFSRFINGEDDGNSFAILVEKIEFDGKGDGYGENNVSGFKVTTGKVVPKDGGYDFQIKDIFYK